MSLVGHAHPYTVHFVSELTECAALSKRCHGQHYLSALVHVHVPLAEGSYLNVYLRTHIPFELDVTRCIRIEFVLDWLHLTPSTICRPPFAWAQTCTSGQMIRATPGAFPERLWSISPKRTDGTGVATTDAQAQPHHDDAVNRALPTTVGIARRALQSKEAAQAHAAQAKATER